jgi:hypothetical protein
MEEEKDTIQWQLKTISRKQDLIKSELVGMGDKIVRALEAVNVTLKRSLETQKAIPLLKDIKDALKPLEDLSFQTTLLEEMYLTMDESKKHGEGVGRLLETQLDNLKERAKGTPLESAIEVMIQKSTTKADSPEDIAKKLFKSSPKLQEKIEARRKRRE